MTFYPQDSKCLKCGRFFTKWGLEWHLKSCNSEMTPFEAIVRKSIQGHYDRRYRRRKR